MSNKRSIDQEIKYSDKRFSDLDKKTSDKRFSDQEKKKSDKRSSDKRLSDQNKQIRIRDSKKKKFESDSSHRPSSRNLVSRESTKRFVHKDFKFTDKKFYNTYQSDSDS